LSYPHKNAIVYLSINNQVKFWDMEVNNVINTRSSPNITIRTKLTEGDIIKVVANQYS
jgi:hypothetical protein